MREGQLSECPCALLADLGFNSEVSVGSVMYVVGALRIDDFNFLLDCGWNEYCGSSLVSS